MAIRADRYWDNLSDNDFENFCYDLLLCLGFINIDWRQGGKDQGRDIEAAHLIKEPGGHLSLERWFIECKKYKGGVPVKELVSKIAWADAEQPDYLLIITSGHLTVATKNWIEKLQKEKKYKIRYWEREILKQMADKYPKLVETYFNQNLYLMRWTHGIKNNLQAAIFNLQFLERSSEIKEPRMQDYLSDSIAFLSDIWNQIITSDLIHSDKLDLEEMFLYREVLSKIPTFVRRSALALRSGSFDITNLKKEGFDKLPKVLANKNGLMQVFYILAGNAVKYCDPNSLTHKLDLSYVVSTSSE